MIWSIFEREADRLYARREFDHIVLSQIWPNNLQNYDGTVRPSILRSYGRPITVPIENVIRLTDDELERTEGYALQNDLAAFRHRILFECSSRSGQSFITPDLAQEVARRLYELIDDATVIFSTDLPMQLADPRSRYAGTLSLRETAHLTRHCHPLCRCRERRYSRGIVNRLASPADDPAAQEIDLHVRILRP